MSPDRMLLEQSIYGLGSNCLICSITVQVIDQFDQESSIECTVRGGGRNPWRLILKGYGLGLTQNLRWAWGQCVVFPIKHVKQFYHLDEVNFNSLFSAVKKIAKKMEDVFDPNYVSIFTRGQTIEHAHVIIFPAGQDKVIDRYGNLIASFESLREKTTDQNLDELEEKLRIK